ncbi:MULTISPECIES: biotin-dependent carboxyltransferase family protein [unclassified Ruegeria]|uniref:5-oxoprolinase subunit C family protein n=1 Tax=unclassified Ruegeria TaxID=2625375 RepID=UPI0014914A9B|nr:MULTISPECIES: biotin-dependent carboxyltransferase family protein [unclassified Ruegeria]NOD49938.1 urea amidolyase [Ruegeria sp. HKCCD5849]NOD54234.1 urea amidolyase [Ruegeria sp. HKCCD5851]NOD68928.1 urea amidolyase [Ruegeria sp. HKCCD7303]
MSLIVHRIGPSCTIQDQGRTGYLDQGLSRSGAADILALHEGAALLGQSPNLAALEMAGLGGEFEVTQDVRIALTGARMQTSIDGSPVAWNASHQLTAGQRLNIGAAVQGNYGYLHLGGGIESDVFLGSRSAHLTARIGRALEQGDRLTCGPDAGQTGLKLTPDERFAGGELRVVASFQTTLFDRTTLDRFAATTFRRGTRANRMGMQVDSDGDGFAASGQLNILSEVITPGDIQMTGTGDPFILLPECQTTGGYPRIATVLPCDMPRAAQTPAGGKIRFRFVSMDEASALHTAFLSELARLPSRVEPLIRDPHDIQDLLSYQLIGGVISATD